jgi:signal transduction histidine kinase
LVTVLKNNKFQLATLKLTLYYVLSTALILLASSIAILAVFAPPDSASVQFRDAEEGFESPYIEWNMHEVREHLPFVIFLVDATILFVVSLLSYSFAHLTLAPIRHMHERQRQFMGDVAHELRTPLSVLKTGAETMLRKTRSHLEYESFISDVQGETERLTRLSNQLLQLLKTNEMSKPVFKNEDISHMVEDEIRRFTPYAAKRKISIMLNVPPNIKTFTERDSLIEIVQNILKNAIDYNAEDGTVTVTVSEIDSSVILEVKDTGVGIPENLQAAVFERFKKGDAARTHTEVSGAGLGLSIVKALAGRLLGAIAIESETGSGTTFTVTLPKRHS